ncbi:circularly permuted type 2 ATP-grasp protein [Prosthecomicrobium sp. N25]|uniref:circularly permuted type 2 ATP-grasp protein n=1 Tax=Prosthecomicrobium sp. N25 TaxID=3129254 RepID=UPI003077EEB7
MAADPQLAAETQLELAMPPGGGSDGGSAGVAALVAAYKPVPGVPDELIDEAGRPRPHWQPVLRAAAALGEAELRRRFEVADRHLADAGVVYRVYGDPNGAERPWPLSHVPLVLSEADWSGLARGVAQRAELLEAVLADLYGPARLVAQGHLPAALVAGNSEYLRPLVGVRPPGGHWLHVYAADVSRGPDGRWWILADRTQAPSGAGYAIENRIALGSRAMPDVFRALNVERLAGFYQTLRSGLAAATGRDEPRIALLSPGPANETYFEHAYLARALGFLLVEGGDLSVRHDAVYLRTVDGPVRADAILRRLDADWADPLEFNAASRLGVPGLAQAVRAGNVVVANALGSGLVEAPALLAFLPALARKLLGEDLVLPNLATWWCGEEGARKAVLQDFAAKALLPAFGRTLRGILDNVGTLGAALDPADATRLRNHVERRGIDVIGQEPVRLATTPVWSQGRLQPRPYSLRVFAARGPDGAWTVMPGGLCRIAGGPDARGLSMQRGGRSADVWVLAEKPVVPVNLIPNPDEIEVRRETGGLPSRAADNLYWLGRYLERAEATLRLARGLAGQTDDDGPDDADEPAARRIADLLAAWGATPFGLEDFGEIAREALFGASAGAVAQLVREARRTASVVRDRISPDAWRALADLTGFFPRPPVRVELGAGELFEAADAGLRTIAAFTGLAHENMYRPAGWRFLDMGARVERAIAVARFTRRLAEGPVGSDMLMRLLDLTDSQVVYRARYINGAALKPVVDLILLDEANPRSVAFQLERLVDHLCHLADRHEGRRADPAERAALRLSTALRTAEAADFDPERIMVLETSLMQVSDAITTRYFGEALPDEATDETPMPETPA